MTSSTLSHVWNQTKVAFTGFSQMKATCNVASVVNEEVDISATASAWVPGPRLFPWDSPVVHDNCSFDLIQGYKYDEYVCCHALQWSLIFALIRRIPDIKAYLAVLGARQPLSSDAPAIPWFWRPPRSYSSLSPEEQRLKTACEDAVRRGVEHLERRRMEKRG